MYISLFVYIYIIAITIMRRRLNHEHSIVWFSNTWKKCAGNFGVCSHKSISLRKKKPELCVLQKGGWVGCLVGLMRNFSACMSR